MAGFLTVPIIPDVKKESNEPDIDKTCENAINPKKVVLEEPSKEELKMAKHVRFKTPKKTTVIQKQNTEYFVGSKAVDTLMSSKWAKPSGSKPPVFVSRDDAIAFMEKLLASRLFYRAEKILKGDKEEKKASKATQSADDSKETKVRKRRKETKEETKKEEEQDKKSTKNGEEKKKKRKYKLDVHEDQVFLDSSDIYVWVYDPLHPKTLVLGGVVLLGVIAATLFPLWPNSVRVGIYYLSVLGGIFVGSVFGVALLRSCLFAVIWAVTLGKHRFWFLPNLLADVGFFDSFKPWYTHEIFGEGKKKKSKEKEKSSDNENEDDMDQEKDGADQGGRDEDATSREDDSEPGGDVSESNRDENASSEEFEVLNPLEKKS